MVFRQRLLNPFAFKSREDQYREVSGHDSRRFPVRQADRGIVEHFPDLFCAEPDGAVCQLCGGRISVFRGEPGEFEWRGLLPAVKLNSGALFSGVVRRRLDF